jgi:hypothetical protein
VRRRALLIAGTAVVGASAVLAFVLGTGGRARELDVAAVRAALPEGARGAFELVVALRGLESGGVTDWVKAETLCRGLGWTRCDRPALEEMKRRAAGTAAPAVANVTWAFGDEDAVKQMFRRELDRIPEADGPARARVFVRFGVIDTNPDGQAALFAQACVADPTLCDRDRLEQAARREAEARFLAPGNALPLYFRGGHRRAPIGGSERPP